MSDTHDPADALARRMLVHQTLLDERLARIENNVVFRMWRRLRFGFDDLRRFCRSLAGRSPGEPATPPARYAAWREARRAAVLNGIGAAPESSFLALVLCDGSAWPAASLASLPPGVETVLIRSAAPAPAGDPPPDVRCVSLDSVPQLLRATSAPFVLLLSPGVSLHGGALRVFAECLHSAGCDVAYADEEFSGEGGAEVPRFKPAWSPELLLAAPYFGGAVAFRRESLLAAGGIRSAQGAELHDACLRVAFAAHRVRHIPAVLSRCTRTAPLLASLPAVRHFAGASASVTGGSQPGTVLVRRRASSSGSLSIVVCSRNARLLTRCIEALASRRTRHEVIAVTHLDAHNAAAMEAAVQRLGCRSIPWTGPFDFSAMNNAAAAVAARPCLLFLNDDVIAGDPEWDERTLAELERDDVGVVGARLLYPNATVQHDGVAVAMGDGAGHPGRFTPGSEMWPWLALTRDVTAVTGAYLAIRAPLFRELHGFDTLFPFNYNDVDLCLRARHAGYRVLCLALDRMIHEECRTRVGVVHVSERDSFYCRWGALLAAGDPLYSPNLVPQERISLNLDMRTPFALLDLKRRPAWR